MNIKEIVNNNWNLKINLMGGRIEELSFKNEIILGTFKRIDEKIGNTHICTPNFGDEGMEKFGLPFHGPFRNMEWKLIFESENRLEIEVIDLKLRVRQIFEINNYFIQKVIVENLGKKERIVNVAIHNYWDSKNGWRESKLNGEKIETLVLKNTYDSLNEKNLIEIAGKRLIDWQVFGCNYGQFWTAFIENDDKKEFDEKYFCMEPSLEKQGFLDNGKNNLGVGEKIEIGQKIKIS